VAERGVDAAPAYADAGGSEAAVKKATKLSKVVDGYTRAVETADLAARLVRLEQVQKK
jgi:hypothetical protein